MPLYQAIFRIKPYLQPFERVLAALELSSLGKLRVDPPHSASNNELHFEVGIPIKELLNRLTYWESITNTKCNLTLQVLRESTVNILRNGISPWEIPNYLPFGHDVPLPGRRCLRYGPHGIHEYRGKFFPQLVRSLANIAGLKKNDIILDPMCGSGTTPVETILLSCRALAIDTNPFSVFMSKTKCDLLSTGPRKILKEYEALLRRIDNIQNNTEAVSEEWIKNLSQKDSEYLRSWFPAGILSDLDQIMSRIKLVESEPIRNLFILSLSNILRRVSYQKTDDLRVRKEFFDESDVNCTAIFLGELERVVKLVLAFLYQEDKRHINTWHVIQGDSREITRILFNYIGKVNAIITSPPYATALPYIDTDRLSLCFFGLLPRSQLREMNLKMVGNREITDSIKDEYWNRYKSQKKTLPSEISRLIEFIYKLNENSDVGFRRRNLPSLLAKYFLDMRDVFTGMKKMLAPNSPAYVVIGNNHTIAGGRRVDIKTDEFLGQIGESIGLKLENMIPMDMLVSRDIFKKNAVATETILCFRNS